MTFERRRDLEESILNLIGLSNESDLEEGLRWSDIKKSILLEYQDENHRTFGTKLHRALKRLQRDGLIVKDPKGHKKIFYKLSEKGQKIFVSHSNSHRITDFTLNSSLSLPLYLEVVNSEEELSYEEFENKLLSKFYRYWKTQIPEMWEEYLRTRGKR